MRSHGGSYTSYMTRSIANYARRYQNFMRKHRKWAYRISFVFSILLTLSAIGAIFTVIANPAAATVANLIFSVGFAWYSWYLTFSFKKPQYAFRSIAIPKGESLPVSNGDGSVYERHLAIIVALVGGFLMLFTSFAIFPPLIAGLFAYIEYVRATSSKYQAPPKGGAGKKQYSSEKRQKQRF